MLTHDTQGSPARLLCGWRSWREHQRVADALTQWRPGPHLGHRGAEQVAWALGDFSKVQANRRTLARVRVLVSLWLGRKSRSPSWLSATVQFSKDLTQKQVKGHTDTSGACPLPGPWPRAVAMRKCSVLFLSKL